MPQKATKKNVSFALQNYLNDKLSYETLLQEGEVSEAFESLCDKLLEEQGPQRMTLRELTEARDRIDAALPDELRRLSVTVSDCDGDRQFARERAAFTFGVEIGRRLCSAELKA